MLKKTLLTTLAVSSVLVALHSKGEFIPLFGNACANCTTDQQMVDHALAEMDRLNQQGDGQYLVQFTAPLAQDLVSVIVDVDDGERNTSTSNVGRQPISPANPPAEIPQ